MEKTFTVPLSDIIKEMGFQEIYLPCDAKEVLVGSCDINRPGLALSGFFEYFDNERIQILGKSEFGFLSDLTQKNREKRLEGLVSQLPVAILVTRNLEIFPEMKALCEQYGVPLLLTADSTSSCMAALIAYLNVQLAPRVTRHGVLVEVYGEGVLLLGDSGIGKSETAIELVKRGHRLIADDAVEIRRVSSKTLVGAAPDNIRHFIELRGVGIVNARRIFGMGAVKLTEKIDMAVKMEPWSAEKVYDRMGLENEYMEILGITVPRVTIPIKPGRNLAIIIEVAAMNNRQKKMGYNAAQELMKNLGMTSGLPTPSMQAEWDKF